MTGKRLAVDQAWDLLQKSHTGILTTVGAGGQPYSLPVWFVVEHRTIFVAGVATTKKFTRIRSEPRVAFLVEAGLAWEELRAVHVVGRATVRGNPDWSHFDALFDAKYARFRTPRAEMPEPTRRFYDTERALMEIAPTRDPMAWDNRALVASESEEPS